MFRGSMIFLKPPIEELSVTLECLLFFFRFFNSFCIDMYLRRGSDWSSGWTFGALKVNVLGATFRTFQGAASGVFSGVSLPYHVYPKFTPRAALGETRRIQRLGATHTATATLTY